MTNDIPAFVAPPIEPPDPVAIAVVRAKVNEGFRSLPYHDSLGFLTIGYGNNLDAGWCEKLAAVVLDFQMREAEQQLHNYAWYQGLDPIRKSVMAEMCFNLGLGKLLGFHDTLAAIGKSDWQAAHDGMVGSLWARQVGKRATELANLMLNT